MKKKDDDNLRRGMVVLPYIEGLAQRSTRIFNKHRISTAFKPHQTLRNILVHPKDKRDVGQTSDCVYEIPCTSCDKTYIGETGRLFETRLTEHKDEAEKASQKKFTRAQRKVSLTGELNKSAITGHVSEENHVIDWEEASIRSRENNFHKRKIRESIWIRKRGPNKTLNRDQGNYFLPNIYDQLLTAPPTAASSHIKGMNRKSGHQSEEELRCNSKL